MSGAGGATGIARPNPFPTPRDFLDVSQSTDIYWASDQGFLVFTGRHSMSLQTSLSVTEQLHEHFNSPAFRELVPALAERFKEDDYVELESFLPPALAHRAEQELADLYDTRSRRRDILVPSTGNTPRNFSNLDRDVLLAGSSVIPAVFDCPALLKRLSEIAGQEVLPVPYVPEEYISARMDRPGDVHGWHWDDYSFAVVWVVKSTPEGCGGDVEYIPDTFWDKENPRLEHYLATREIRRRHPASGTAYLMRTDTSLHHVTPIAEGVERIMVCFSYCSLEDLDREVTHDTMDLLHPNA